MFLVLTNVVIYLLSSYLTKYSIFKINSSDGASVAEYNKRSSKKFMLYANLNCKMSKKERKRPENVQICGFDVLLQI